MTMAAAIESRTAEAQAWSKASRIASVDIVGDLGAGRGDLARPRSRAVLHAVSALRFPRTAGNGKVGERDGLSPFIVIAYDAERRPLLLLPLALGQQARHSHRLLHGRQARHLQHGAVGPRFCRERNRCRSRRAAGGNTRALRRRRSGADPAAAALARLAEPDGAAAEATLGQRLPAADDGAGRCPGRADQQLVPPPPEGQGAQAARRCRAIAITSRRRTPISSGCSTGSSRSSRCGWRNRNCPTCSPNRASRISSATPA